MSSDSHSDHYGHDSHDNAHPVATDVIPETSLQDMLLKVLTICAAGSALRHGFLVDGRARC